jgi:M6 family metalloprotease-like protein
MKKLSLIILTIVFGTVPLMACPGYSKPVDVLQPDGSTITLLMHGDEYRHFITTTDGYTVVKDNDGFYHYADKDTYGQLAATKVIAKNASERDDNELSFLANRKKMIAPDMTKYQKEMQTRRLQMQRDYTSPFGGKRNNRAGTIWPNIDYSKFKGLIILVEFSDRKFTTNGPKTLYQRLTSEKNYSDTSHEYYPVDVEGSARDYFYENSLGIFDPTFKVVGPVQIDMKSTDMGGYNASPQTMSKVLKKVLTGVDNEIDFSEYDTDNDGYIDMCYFIFAGYGSYMQGNNEKYLWPHADDFSQNSRWSGMRYDGRYFGRYACSVELMDLESLSESHQYLDGIGTICHEFSHVLGLADHYDTDYEENGLAKHPEYWDIMASATENNYGLTPVGYNAFERYVLGFTTPGEINAEGNYTLNPFNTSNECLILQSGTDNEFFFIENRQQQRWDRFLPGHGMLVWRANLADDYAWKNNMVNVSPNNMHFELLNAAPDKNISTEYLPFPGKGNNTDLTTVTSPALISSKRTEAPYNLYNITESTDGVITFEASKEQKYKRLIEDFEMMDVTTTDATNVKGIFCNWTFNKAVVEWLTDIYGNGQQAVKVNRNGTIESSPLTMTLLNLSFQVWSENYQTRVTTRYKAEDTNSWTIITSSNGKSTEIIDKNSTATLSYNTVIPKGYQIQILVQGGNTATVGHIDDITVSVREDVTNTNAIESIQVAHRDNSQTYNLNGQKVGNHYRGITIRNGKKHLMR